MADHSQRNVDPEGDDSQGVRLSPGAREMHGEIVGRTGVMCALFSPMHTLL